MRTLVDGALAALSVRFEGMYATCGRPSIAPEKLLRALLLQVLYTVRSERQLMEQLEYNLLFRWFVGLNMDDPVWDVTVFTKNRERLLSGDVAEAFFAAVLDQARTCGLLSAEHFTVDGTLVQAWASHKSFHPKDQGPAPPDAPDEGTWRGKPRSNQTHASLTDPDARLYRKAVGAESKLCYMGHTLMENRNGLLVNATVTRTSGTAEREAALHMLARSMTSGCTLGADKGYDVRDFVEQLRERRITPHIARRIKYSALDGRSTRHTAYAISQKVRKRVEQAFGWMKSIGNLRQTKMRGIRRVMWAFQFTAAAYNLVRLRSLIMAPT
jgi:transposase